MFVDLDNLCIHVFGHGVDGSYCRCAAAHDHDILHVDIFLLAYYLSDVGDIVLGGHEVGEVVEFQLVVATRDDGLLSAFHRDDMEGVVGTAYLAQWLI